MGAFWNTLWPILVAVLLFAVMIFIHEFGHFIAAKICGVKVNEFAVGFGPKLLKKKIGETVYAINLIPLGGYCAMEGEDEESDDDGAFNKKPAWQRFIIIAAGAMPCKHKRITFLNLLISNLSIAATCAENVIVKKILISSDG